MKTVRARITALATVALLMTLGAGTSYAGKVTPGNFCDQGERSPRLLVHTYLTGKENKYTKRLLVSPSSKLPLNGRLRAKIDGSKFAFVSLPYFAKGDAKLTVRGGMSKKSEGWVAEYALKSSAKSWSDFSVNDLVLTACYKFQQAGNPVSTFTLNAKSPRGVKPGRVTVGTFAIRGFTADIMLKGAAASSGSRASGKATPRGGNRSSTNKNRTRRGPRGNR